jgi:hypothetical protein
MCCRRRLGSADVTTVYRHPGVWGAALQQVGESNEATLLCGVIVQRRKQIFHIDVETDEAIDSSFLSACDIRGLLISQKRLRDHVVAAGFQSNL